MGKKIYSLVKKNESILALYTLLSRIRHGDKAFIHFVLTAEQDPDLLRVIRKGTENSGKVVYLIKECGRGYGFFAEFNEVLYALYYADSMGFVPHVMWGKNFNYYDEDMDIENAFEYFFEPITVPNYQMSNAIVEKRGIHIAQITKGIGALGYNRSLSGERIKADICKKYIHLKKDIYELLEKNVDDVIGNSKTVGVHYRGTDYKKGFIGHPVHVELNTLVEQVKKIRIEENAEKIFLATDDNEAVDVFQKEFGEALCSYDDTLRSDGEVSVAFSNAERKLHKYHLAWEVMRDAYTLSRCDSLVAGLSQVSFAAQTFKQARSEKYSKRIVIDNGINTTGDFFQIRK